MKLVRYGKAGEEKPGIIDRAGRIRDLSGEVDDIAGAALGAAELRRLAALDPGERCRWCRATRGSAPASAGSATSSPSASTMPTTPPRPATPIPAEPILFNKAPLLHRRAQ